MSADIKSGDASGYEVSAHEEFNVSDSSSVDISSECTMTIPVDASEHESACDEFNVSDNSSDSDISSPEYSMTIPGLSVYFSPKK